MLNLARIKPRRAVSSAELRDWLASPRAAALLQAEQQWLQERLQRCFGSYLLVYNAATDTCWQSDIRHQVHVGTDEQVQDAICSECLWPVQPDGADVVLLQHSLEFAGSPYDLLREAAQAVRPGGYLLLIGRNPWWLGFAGNRLWRRGHRLSAGRVSEWLAVLGFAVETPRFAHYLPACGQRALPRLESFLGKKQWPLGACYMIAARKQVHAAPAQRQRNRRLKGLLPMPVAQQTIKPDIAEEQCKHD